MINTDTIRFMKTLDDLAQKTIVGIEQFDPGMTPSLFDKLLTYDDESYDRMTGGYKLVKSAIVQDSHSDAQHLEITQHYEDTDDYSIRVRFDDDEPYVSVTLKDGGIITIENGEWYFAN